MLERQYSNSRFNFVFTMDGDTVQVVPTGETVAIVTREGITSYPAVPLCGTSLETAGPYFSSELEALKSYRMDDDTYPAYVATSLDNTASTTCVTPVCGADTSYARDVNSGIHTMEDNIRSDTNIEKHRHKYRSSSKVCPYPKFTSILDTKSADQTIPYTDMVHIRDNKGGIQYTVPETEIDSAGSHPNETESTNTRNCDIHFQGMDSVDNAEHSAIISPTAKSFIDSANLGNPCEQTLMDATEEAFVSGTLTPLIKEELKYSIQSRRLKEGKAEMEVEFRHPQEYKLTEDERKKVETRRVQNRMAARRFRDKQKDRGEYLQKHCQRIESMNTELRYELNQLKKERDELKQLIQEHFSTCPSARQSFNR